jgi:hypothetical protein
MFEFGLIALAGIIIMIVAGIFAAEMDSGFIAAATFVIGLLTLEFGFGIGVWAMISGNFLWFFAFALLYAALSSAFVGFWRWPEYIRNNHDRIMNAYMEWSRTRKNTQDNSFDAFMDSDSYKFKVRMHKERIGTWAAMWPWSLAWELSRKPAIWIWNTMYTSLGEALEKIGRNTARKIHDKATK